MGSLLAVAGGGAVGGLGRSAVGKISATWPWPTLVVNLAGAFVLGVVVTYGRRHWRPPQMAAVSVGLLGAFTTFSTLTGELWNLQDAADWGRLASYGAATIVGGVGAATAGLRVGRVIR